MRRNINKEMLIDLFSTSTYGSEWFGIATLKSEQYIDSKFDKEYLENRCREERWADRLLNGGHIVLKDYYPQIEDGEDVVCVKLNLEEFTSRFEKAKVICPTEYAQFINEEYDHYTCNNLMQVVMFGEVIYG